MRRRGRTFEPVKIPRFFVRSRDSREVSETSAFRLICCAQDALKLAESGLPMRFVGMTTGNSSSSASDASSLPPIIQGGMGVGVSGWRLARAVSQCGQLGVLSGTALDLLLTRQLQLGDIDGNLRRALAAFPYPEIAARILERYFIPGGKAADAPFKTPPMISH